MTISAIFTGCFQKPAECRRKITVTEKKEYKNGLYRLAFEPIQAILPFYPIIPQFFLRFRLFA